MAGVLSISCHRQIACPKTIRTKILCVIFVRFVFVLEKTCQIPFHSTARTLQGGKVHHLQKTKSGLYFPLVPNLGGVAVHFIQRQEGNTIEKGGIKKNNDDGKR